MGILDATSQLFLLNTRPASGVSTGHGFWSSLRRLLRNSLVSLICVTLIDIAASLWLRASGLAATLTQFSIQLLLFVILLMLATTDSLLRSGGIVSPPRGIVVSCGFVIILLLHLILRVNSRSPAESFLLLLHGAVFFGGYEILSGLSDQGSRKRVAILGLDPLAGRVADYLQKHPELRFDVTGFIDRRSKARTDTPAELPRTSFPVLGSVDEFETVCRRNFIDEVLVSLSSSRALIDQVIELGRKHRVVVRIVPDALQEFAEVAQPSFVGQFPTLAVGHKQENVGALFVKRSIDLMLSATGLVFLAPLFVLIAFIVRFDSRGPVFYRSERIGRKGRAFRCWKFRTMVVDAEQRKRDVEHLNQRNSILFKVEHDPRITAVGRFLRKYSLDELPQLINVLLGEMSLVGPRPCLPSEMKRYEIEALRRLEATPGITGLWQVKARRDPSFETYLSMDLTYIDNWNLWLDMTILANTLRVVFTGTGQ